MRHLTAIIAGGLLSGALFCSCDSVSEPDRFVDAEIIPHRAILIEEFTGQNCTNCPDGHQAIKDISAFFGDSVVAVGVHASGLAIPEQYGGYATETGEQYYQRAGSPALPTAVINLQTDPLQVSDWGASINRLILDPTPFTVIADAKVSDDGQNFEINVAYASGDDYQGRLMVWVVENDLVGRQLDHGTWIFDYVHNHVFRAAATPDIWGQPVDFKANESQYATFKCPIQSTWNPAHLYAVAFLYNDEGVQQVTATKH